MATSAAWANPHDLHPWFRASSHKRKDLDEEEEDTTSVFYEPRRSLSPAPSPKRRRCDVLENGLSQLTLDGHGYRTIRSANYLPPNVPRASYGSPSIYFPDPSPQRWTEPPSAPQITSIPLTVPGPVVLPGSVEEPVSSETVEGDVPVRDVAMKTSSWYEIEKDRTSLSPPPSPSTPPSPPYPLSTTAPPLAAAAERRAYNHTPPTPTPFTRRSPDPADAASPPRTGIVITDLEDSDTEGEDGETASASSREPAFTISTALLDRLPKLGPLAPDPVPSASTALVLYRPLAVPASTTLSHEDEDEDERLRDRREEGLGRDAVIGQGLEPMGSGLGMGEEEPMDTRPGTPMALELGSVAVVGVDEDEPMDIEML